MVYRVENRTCGASPYMVAMIASESGCVRAVAKIGVFHGESSAKGRHVPGRCCPRTPGEKTSERGSPESRNTPGYTAAASTTTATNEMRASCTRFLNAGLGVLVCEHCGISRLQRCRRGLSGIDLNSSARKPHQEPEISNEVQRQKYGADHERSESHEETSDRRRMVGVHGRPVAPQSEQIAQRQVNNRREQ